jgi:hypothetical protein
VANGRAWCSMQHRPELGAIEATSKGAWGQWHAEGRPGRGGEAVVVRLVPNGMLTRQKQARGVGGLGRAL